MNRIRIVVECLVDNAVIDSVMRTIEANAKKSQDEAIGEALGTALIYLTRPEHREKAVKAFNSELK